MRIELFRGEKEPDTDAVDHLELLTTFELAGIGALKENSVSKKEGSSKPKVSLSFEMTRSGFVELSKVEAKIDELVTYNETVKVPKVNTGESAGEEATPEAAEAAPSEEAAGEAQSGVEGESAEGQAAEEAEKKPKEPEYVEEIVTKTKNSPHTFPIRKVTVLHRDSRQLTEEQKQAARKRVRAFDSRDQMKFKTDEAKNNFEAICYSFRDWLQSEENLPFVGETRQEELIAKIMDNLEWLDYGDGDTAGYEEFEKRYTVLRSEQQKLQERQEEAAKREQGVEKARQKLAELVEKAQVMREKKDWILEAEQQDVIEKAQEAQQWLEERMNEQSQLTPLDEPAFTARQLDKRVKDAEKLYKNVFGKKKPKKTEKIEKINLEDVETIEMPEPETINFESENIKFENVNFGEGVNAEDFIKIEKNVEQE